MKIHQKVCQYLQEQSVLLTTTLFCKLTQMTTFTMYI